MFETFIVRPVFNLLLAIYSYVPGGDFGVAIIVFTIVVRLSMWPLLRRQLHQTRAMRALQPEIKKIKAQTKGDRTKEAALLQELYRERGVSAFGTIGTLLVQLPILFGLFSAIRSLSNPEQILRLPYSWLRGTDQAQAMLGGVVGQTNEAVAAASAPEVATPLWETIKGGVDLGQLDSFTKDQLNTLYETLLVNGEGSALVEGPFFSQDLFWTH